MHNGLRLMTLWSGEESVSSAIIAQEMEIFLQKLASYELKLICNVDGNAVVLQNDAPDNLLVFQRGSCTTRAQRG